MESETKTRYLTYISYLNDRLTNELQDFVQEEVIYNGNRMSRVEYQNMIAAQIKAAPDLYFDTQILLVDGDHIACIIFFECTPQEEFLGFQPNGKTISFSEHVFYTLKDGKISEVWSLLDYKAIEAQLMV